MHNCNKPSSMKSRTDYLSQSSPNHTPPVQLLDDYFIILIIMVTKEEQKYTFGLRPVDTLCPCSLFILITQFQQFFSGELPPKVRMPMEELYYNSLTWFLLWLFLLLHSILKVCHQTHVFLMICLHQFWQSSEEPNRHTLRCLQGKRNTKELTRNQWPWCSFAKQVK